MRVLWSHLAEKTYYDNLDYLLENWSVEVVNNFILEVEVTMKLLDKNPDIFKWWDVDKKYKIGYINRQISFFYSFDHNGIYVHLFWNNPQDPFKLEKYLI